MRTRRNFITLLGGAAAAWPLPARAQQAATPVVGWLGSGSPQVSAANLAAFHKGLNETGFVEGKNVRFAYRWAEGHYERLAELTTDLIHLPVAAILASGGSSAAVTAKAATSTVPIVFTAAADPVALGLVASLNRPGGNITGANFLIGEARGKQLGLLHELMPEATTVGVLFNPDTANDIDAITSELEAATRPLGLRFRVLLGSTTRQIDEVFASFAGEPVDVLLVTTEPFLTAQQGQILAQAALHRLPAISGYREFAKAGGLMSYGGSPLDAYHQAGVYIARILKGEKPADLPVVRSTRLDLVINMKTAKALGLNVPAILQATADEVIE
jgi:putative ABC transport system substrate-binding protein